MKRLILVAALAASAGLTAGCEHPGSAAGGAVGGAALGVGAYEYNAHRQMQQLDADYRAGKMNRKEYEIRKDQIEKGSLFQR